MHEGSDIYKEAMDLLMSGDPASCYVGATMMIRHCFGECLVDRLQASRRRGTLVLSDADIEDVLDFATDSLERNAIQGKVQRDGSLRALLELLVFCRGVDYVRARKLVQCDDPYEIILATTPDRSDASEADEDYRPTVAEVLACYDMLSWEYALLVRTEVRLQKQLGHWPSLKELTDGLNELYEPGLPETTVKPWRQRAHEMIRENFRRLRKRAI